MVRILRPLVLVEVTPHTITRRALIDVVEMAAHAVRDGVGSPKGEARVLEAPLIPGWIRRRVTQLACRWKSCREVIRLTRLLKVLLVTLHTIERGTPFKHLVAVAGVAPQQAVLRAQRHSGFRLVLPGGLDPRARQMARLAVRPEPKLVSVVLSAIPVTIKTGGWCPAQHSVHVAGRAWNRHVLSIKPKLGCVMERQ